MIKPTNYDEDGYPVQWVRSGIPANSLASVYGLAMECVDKQILGRGIDIQLHVIDETNEYVNIEELAKMVSNDGGNGLVGLIGVQTNQFPRSMDLAKRFLDFGLQVCIGGFHVSGILSMFNQLTPELEYAQQLGISFFAGEAEEGRLGEVLKDAYNRRMKPIYNYLKDLPTLENEPIPLLPANEVNKTSGAYGSFDLGRGCPFDCSFCTIINVQGKKSRYRTADDLEKILRENHQMGIHRFFVTDDNFARNKNWESMLDRIISIRNEGINIRMNIQVDTLSHTIPRFVDKCVAAGVDEVFIGLENINAENLLSVKKKQNKISDYKQMLLTWKQYPVVIVAGYIIGLPNDTHASVIRDVETIKSELAIDMLYFTMLTPLPGSEDHKILVNKGVWMDEDLNKYNLNHRVTHHMKMSDEEWDRAYDDAWNTFYSRDHMKTIFKRMTAFKSNKKMTTLKRLLYYREFRRIYGLHPLEGGYIRIKRRLERRPGYAIEPIWIFYPKFWFQTFKTMFQMWYSYRWLRFTLEKIWNDPKRYEYRDSAMQVSQFS